MTYKHLTFCVALLFSSLLLVQCQTVDDAHSLRMNEIQFLGSHNSYKQAIDPGVMAQLTADNPAVAASLDYWHAPLGRQFDAGMRKIELDVYYDPEGGRYASPLGTRLVRNRDPYDPDGLMKERGFKVFHVQDIDYRSHCLLFRQCLSDVKVWSDAHPRHLPIYISINAKADAIDRPGFVTPLPFDADAWKALDQEIVEGLGDRLLTPDMVRGDRASLRDAVLAGWPTIDSVRGKVVFVLDDSAEKKASYSAGHPSLAGRAMFIDAPEDTAEAAIRIVNDPIAKEAYIRDLVKTGFIVRTRADADTKEARTGDYVRYQAALRSGAQIISTDYYFADDRFGTGFVVKLPGDRVARCNPALDTPCELNDPQD